MSRPHLRSNSEAEILDVSRVYWDTGLNSAAKLDNESQGRDCYRCEWERMDT